MGPLESGMGLPKSGICPFRSVMAPGLSGPEAMTGLGGLASPVLPAMSAFRSFTGPNPLKNFALIRL